MKKESSIYYHYCSLQTFYKIIKSQNIRLCNSYKMNDWQENKWANKILKDEYKKIYEKTEEKDRIYLENFINSYLGFGQEQKNDILEKPKEYISFIASFSKKSDMLSQWRAYADDGRGAAIGFDFDTLGIDKNNKDLFWTIHQETSCGIKYYENIEYDLEKQKENIEELVDLYIKKIHETKKDLAPLLDLIKNISLASLKFKNEGFKEEKEVRIIYIPGRKNVDLEYDFYAKSDTIVKFFKLKFKPNNVISEIILGPKCNMKYNDLDLKEFLNKNGLDKTKIRNSEISYK